jgi:hypothetical protein
MNSKLVEGNNNNTIFNKEREWIFISRYYSYFIHYPELMDYHFGDEHAAHR